MWPTSTNVHGGHRPSFGCTLAAGGGVVVVPVMGRKSVCFISNLYIYRGMECVTKNSVVAVVATTVIVIVVHFDATSCSRIHSLLKDILLHLLAFDSNDNFRTQTYPNTNILRVYIL